jgi:phage baseplate assembly protein W
MKGLSTRFNLDNGKFQLSTGVEKSTDSIWFFSVFDRKRIYLPDFGGNFNNLIQKPTSFLVVSKSIIQNNIKTGVEKYVPSVELLSVDIGIFPTDRTTTVVKLEYVSVDDTNNKVKSVIFV